MSVRARVLWAGLVVALWWAGSADAQVRAQYVGFTNNLSMDITIGGGSVSGSIKSGPTGVAQVRGSFGGNAVSMVLDFNRAFSSVANGNVSGNLTGGLGARAASSPRRFLSPSAAERPYTISRCGCRGHRQRSEVACKTPAIIPVTHITTPAGNSGGTATAGGAGNAPPQPTLRTLSVRGSAAAGATQVNARAGLFPASGNTTA